MGGRASMLSPMPTRGELEQRVMELLWAAPAPKSVAEVHQMLSSERELAYTTVMTVLDRLAKKEMVTRELVNRAWQYEPRDTQAAVIARELALKLDGVEPGVRAEALRRFVETLSAEERAALGHPLPA